MIVPYQCPESFLFFFFFGNCSVFHLWLHHIIFNSLFTDVCSHLYFILGTVFENLFLQDTERFCFLQRAPWLHGLLNYQRQIKTLPHPTSNKCTPQFSQQLDQLIFQYAPWGTHPSSVGLGWFNWGVCWWVGQDEQFFTIVCYV